MYNNGKDIMPEDLKITDEGKRLVIGLFNPDTPNKPKFYTVGGGDRLTTDDVVSLGEDIKSHLVRAFNNADNK